MESVYVMQSIYIVNEAVCGGGEARWDTDGRVTLPARSMTLERTGRAKVLYRSRPPSMTARITRPRTPPMVCTLLLALWEP